MAQRPGPGTAVGCKPYGPCRCEEAQAGNSLRRFGRALLRAGHSRFTAPGCADSIVGCTGLMAVLCRSGQAHRNIVGSPRVVPVVRTSEAGWTRRRPARHSLAPLLGQRRNRSPLGAPRPESGGSAGWRTGKRRLGSDATGGEGVSDIGLGHRNPVSVYVRLAAPTAGKSHLPSYQRRYWRGPSATAPRTAHPVRNTRPGDSRRLLHRPVTWHLRNHREYSP